MTDEPFRRPRIRFNRGYEAGNYTRAGNSAQLEIFIDRIQFSDAPRSASEGRYGPVCGRRQRLPDFDRQTLHCCEMFVQRNEGHSMPDGCGGYPNVILRYWRPFLP